MTDLALFLLRLAGLGLALAHGLGKVTALASGSTAFVDGVAQLGLPWPGAFAWAAALAELIGGLLVFLGFGTRVAAAFCAVTMVVAAFARHHAHDLLLLKLGLLQAPAEHVKAWGNPELALVYLLAFLALTLLGGGQFALERAFKKGRR